MKQKMRSILTVCLCAIAFVCLSVCRVYAADTTTITITPTYGQTEARSMLSMINEFRTGDEAWYWNSDNTTKTDLSGTLGELTYDYELEAIAMQRAAEIAVSYSHTRPNGDTCWTAYTSTYSNTYRAENIAAGYKTAEAVFEGWQETDDDYNGQGHRRNMLSSNHTSVGIGHVIYNGTHYWVQEFSSKVSSAAETTALDTASAAEVEVAESAIQNQTFSFPTAFNLTYGGSAALPDIVMSFSTEDTWPTSARIVLSAVPEYTVADESVVTVSDGKLIAKALGTTTVTLTAFGESREVPVTVNPIDLSNAAITLGVTSCVYTGSAQTPTVSSVKCSGSTLIKDTDYTVSYTNNINAGTAVVTVTGKGNYTGSCTKSFAITRKPVTGVSLGSIAAQTYQGSAITPAVTLSDSSYKKGTDYTVSYKNNVNAGTAVVTVTFSGNYSGTIKTNFKITAKKLSADMLSAISDQTYSGKALTPAVTVRDGSVKLTKGTDYTVAYSNNVKAGTAAVTVTGKGNYSGTVKGSFQILKKVTKIKITGISKKIAAGKKIQLKATVTPSDASNKKIVWKTSNSKVATVNSKGLVTVKKNTGGKKVTIRAVAKDGSGVTAKYVIQSMKGKVKKIAASNLTIKAGKTAKIKVKITATSGANKTLTYTSSNKKYATVSSSGKVKALKKGKGKTVKITIRATDGSGKSKTIKVKIK